MWEGTIQFLSATTSVRNSDSPMQARRPCLGEWGWLAVGHKARTVVLLKFDCGCGSLMLFMYDSVGHGEHTHARVQSKAHLCSEVSLAPRDPVASLGILSVLSGGG